MSRGPPGLPVPHMALKNSFPISQRNSVFILVQSEPSRGHEWTSMVLAQRTFEAGGFYSPCLQRGRRHLPVSAVEGILEWNPYEYRDMPVIWI